MLSHAPRLAARRVVRVERRLAAPFASIGRLESRAAALASATVLAVVGVAASLVAAFHLGELLGAPVAGRTAMVVVVIAWVVANDAVEPLGLRLRDLAGSLAGHVDTYRPIAAAWLSAVRAGVFAAAVPVAVVAATVSVQVGATIGLFALALVASQAESVARRRAWALSDASPDRGARRARGHGRDEELVHAITGGAGGDDAPQS